MTSWFARTISATLNLDESESEPEPEPEPEQQPPQNDDVKHPETNESPPLSPNRSVKEDLSELTKTVTRQFWGVASFLAPPATSNSDPPSDPDGSEIIPGIRSDFAEIGGRFRSGISKLSDNVASVSEITSKMASNFLQLGSDEEERREGFDGVVGITDAVVHFVGDITMHPDTWLDFPLPDHENDQDFDMSDAQQEHALAVERLVPRLAALRMELCPGYMSEAWFWKIYFILLHPRLDLRDAEVLSTPQILEARALLTHNIKKPANANPEEDWSSREASYTKDSTNSQGEEHFSVPIETSVEPVDFPVVTAPETEKHPITSSEIQIVDKSVIEEGNVKQKKDQNSRSASASSIVENNDEDDADDWLKEESSGIGSSKETPVPIDNDDDVSFSDLEEDEVDDSAS